MPAPTRPLHLAVAIDGRQEHSAADHVELARLAEHGTLDFVTLGDSPPDAPDAPDALDVLMRVATATDRIGLVPTVTTTRAEPFRVPAALAALDRASGGRSGWTVRVSATRAGLQGAESSVRGFSAGPSSPQGQPVIAVPATDPDALEIAARHADVAYVRATDRPSAVTAREALRSRARAHGRDPGALIVLADLVVDFSGGENRAGATGHSGGPLYRGGPVRLADLIADWQQSGAVDGFRIRPVDPSRDLERFVNGTVALLQHRSLFRNFYPGTTLREHLGLRRPVWEASPI
jgi:alkanesulfonate monooxygenase SsuD/methylene tetrahydromethanopterin reductase-like flavin-dependent oxidoreductase (luciferase family)